MLYRPFLHYISPKLSAGKTVDDRYYACAAAGISVSRNIIHIAREIKNQAFVVGPFWSMLYTEFFAVLTLVFYVLENTDKPGSAEIFADALVGRQMITNLAPRSFAADKIKGSLDALWSNLPEAVKNGQAKAMSSRKRSLPGSKASQVPMNSTKSPNATAKMASAASRRPHKQRPSFDSAHRTPSQRALAMSYSELHPLDITSIGLSSDMSSNASSTANSSNQFMRASQTVESPSIYKLDEMMFPSGDPFAYPSQPLLDYGETVVTHAGPQRSSISGPHGPQTDSRNFYMPGLYGDIEGQLSMCFLTQLAKVSAPTSRTTANLFFCSVGSLPQYMMQPPPSQNGLDLYQSAQSLPMHLAQSHHTGHGQQQQQQRHHSQHHLANREMEDIMADSGFNRSWDLFGGNFKPL